MENTPDPGAGPARRFPGQPRRLTGAAMGAGEEARVGGEEGGKGEETGSTLGREGDIIVGDVDVARARARGGTLRRTRSCGGMCERELRRESLGEEGSASITVNRRLKGRCQNFRDGCPNPSM